MKKSIAVLLVLIFALSLVPFAAVAEEVVLGEDERCTSVYFGKAITDNGSYIWGRSEDTTSTYTKNFNVQPAASHNIDAAKFNNYDGNWQDYNGDMYVSGTWNATFTTFTPAFRWPYPAKTLRYMYNNDSLYNDRYAPQPYGEVGMNEKGVSISATETLSGMKSQVTALDPSVSRNNGGLSEADVASVVLMQAETARGACELIAKIIDTVGAGGREGLFLSDSKEVWYFQWFTGHQYVAVKCPDNMIGFSPNITGNVGPNGVVDVTDTANVIASPNLIKIAMDAGVYVGDPNDPDNTSKIKVCDSYGTTVNHQTARMRTGWGIFYGYTTDVEISANVPGNIYMNFFLNPPANKKFSLYDAMRFLAARGEGTDWEAASSIGNSGTLEAHIYELRPGMPSEIATVMWMTMAPPEFSVYLPFYGNLVTEVIEKYYSPDPNPRGYDSANPDNNSMYWVLRELHTQCASSSLPERARIGNGVRDFWETYQKSLISQQALIDQYMLKVLKTEGLAKAQEVATSISKSLSAQTYDLAKALLAEVKEFKASGNTGSFKSKLTAAPLYAGLILDKVVPTASVEKLKGNQNELTVKVTETYLDGSTKVFSKVFTIDNNAIGTYKVGEYKVYVDTKGNVQIRECYIVK